MYICVSTVTKEVRFFITEISAKEFAENNTEYLYHGSVIIDRPYD
jgi:hypothetical protein